MMHLNIMFFGVVLLIAGVTAGPATVTDPKTKGVMVLDTPIPCIPGQKIASPASCQTYYICYHGKVLEQVCPDGKFFDKKISDCRFGSCYCTTTENALDCHTYYSYCKFDERTENSTVTCPDGMLFDGVLEECVTGSKALCGPDHCLDGYIRATIFSEGYETCERGKWVYQECSLFHHYDPVKKVCTSACSQELITPSTEHCTIGNQTCGWMRVYNNDTQAWRFNWQCVSTQVREQFCTREDPVIDPDDCQSYWDGHKCGEHVFWSQDSCWLFRRFNNITQSCQFSWDCVRTNYSGVSHEGEAKIDQEDCQSYWKGYKTGWVLESCWYFKRFNSATDSCNWSLKCLDEPPKCKDGEKEVDPVNCQNYKLCVQGTWIKQWCAQTEKFNDKTHQCEASDKCF